ncbi:MAG TPA: serine hydrolase [Candidatus Dormibacteraeota bacterium]
MKSGRIGGDRRWGRLGIRLILVTLIALASASAALDVSASNAEPAAVAAAAVPTPAPTAAISVTPAARDADSLAAAVAALVAGSGATVGVSVVELGGTLPLSWSSNGTGVFTAASTYKLAALMVEAQRIAAGTTDPNGLVYFEDSDYEDGVFDDYSAGAGFTRIELAYRAAHYSDNTAGHMLVRDVGGAGALNAWVAALGATGSSFFDGNTTTATDLTALWVAEAQGRLGGAAAQAWLYPLLTRTSFESGIPAGTSGATVVHKTGALDLTENDTALLLGAPSGPYVLTVLTDGLDETAGPTLIASIARAVETFESARSAPQ